MAKRGRKPKITPDTTKMLEAAELLGKYMDGDAEEKAKVLKDAERIAEETTGLEKQIAAKEKEIADKETEIAQLKNELAQLKASAQGVSKALGIVKAIKALSEK